MPSRCGPLPGHLPGRRVQPADHPGRLSDPRGRASGQRPQLALGAGLRRRRLMALPRLQRADRIPSGLGYATRRSPTRFMRFRDDQGRSHSDLRPAGLQHARHLAAVRTTLLAENWSGPVRLRSSLDGSTTNSGVADYAALANHHLESVRTAELTPDTVLLESRTNQSQITIAMAARTRAFLQGEPLAVDRSVFRRTRHRGRSRAQPRPGLRPAGGDRESGCHRHLSGPGHLGSRHRRRLVGQPGRHLCRPFGRPRASVEPRCGISSP